MVNNKYSSKGPLKNTYTKEEIKSIRFVTSKLEEDANPENIPHIAHLKVISEKIERANEWTAVIQDYRN